MDWLEILKAALLGIVQGITEWLPISSTGHMILVDEFVHLQVSDAFREMFMVVIQFGSILAVVVLYFHRLNPFSPHKTARQRRETISLWTKVIVAAIPAALIGIPFNDIMDELFYNSTVVAIALIVYGVLFIVIENRNRHRKPVVTSFQELSYRRALGIGAFQTLALIPGTSRSGSTILGAMLLGTERNIAAEFSFFLALPVMLGASGIKLLKFGFHFTAQEWAILVTGMLVAFVVSLFAIRFLMGYIRRHDFKAFGVYRIVLGIVVLLYFLVR